MTSTKMLADAVVPEKAVDSGRRSRRDGAHREVPRQRDDHLLHARHHRMRHFVDRFGIATVDRTFATRPDGLEALPQLEEGHVEAELVELRVGQVDRGFGRHHGLACQTLRAPTADPRQRVQHGSQPLHDVIVGIRKGAVDVEAERADSGKIEHQIERTGQPRVGAVNDPTSRVRANRPTARRWLLDTARRGFTP